MSGNQLVRAIGWPNEFQARLMIIDACKTVGSRTAHPLILKYFGWSQIYIDPEEL